MVFVEKLVKQGKEYYYISKNFRVGYNKWKRIKKYAGKNRPSKEQISKIAKEIEKEAIKKGLSKKISKYEFLSDEQAEVLQDLKESYNKWWKSLSKETQNKYKSDFLVRFTYNSNAIEGNTLSLRETNMILQEKIIPSDINEKDYKEVINGKQAMDYVRSYKGELNKTFLLNIHKFLTKEILSSAGNYRTEEVMIMGSDLILPKHKQVPELMKKFFIWYNNNKNKYHPLELASFVHTKFVRIHPFSDGNGRTARLIMNFILKKKGFSMFLIQNSKRTKYYKALEESDNGNEKMFIDLLFNNIVEQHKK